MLSSALIDSYCGLDQVWPRRTAPSGDAGVTISSRRRRANIPNSADAAQAAATRIGTFRFRSGQTTDVYFDKYLFEADPALLWAVAEHAKALIPPDTEVLAGLELGGVPVATALSICTGLPAAFVRKEPKRYGTMKLAEGAEVRGRKVVIVEDVITTGGQVVSSTAALRALGSQVEAVLCIIDRRDGRPGLDSVELEVRPLFRSADLSP